MKNTRIAITTLLLVSCAAFTADLKPAANIDSAAAFSRLKALAGEWEAKGDMGSMRLTYTVIAGGTALVEREVSEHMPEMLTVFYMDGKRLLLSHYCMAGNQPRMQAQAYNAASGDLQFQFLDATNLPNPSAGHMRSAAFRFVDDKHISTEWKFYENGQVKMTENTQFTRVR
jgi:hypothetical protein